MSNIRIPTIPSHDLASHSSDKSCYVTLGANVYNITSFLADHPGGSALILEYGGKDVSKIMGDETSHVHSEAAYEILNENLIGFVENEASTKAVIQSVRPEDIIPSLQNAKRIVALKSDNTTATDLSKMVFAATGLSGVEDLTKDTDPKADYKTHRFIDLNKPLLAQVWNGKFTKEFYLEQVYRPRYYTKGDSAPLFGNFLEPLSKTAWYVPIIYLPGIVWATLLANQGMSSTIRTAEYLIVGLGLWPLIEYGVHRGVFHMDSYLLDNRVAITMHFILHGLHHYLPMDKYRIVTPPSILVLLAAPLYNLVHFVFYWDWHAATAVCCGAFFGYIYYELTHYFLHYKTLPSTYKSLKKYHLQHHYADYENGFGVTTRFWDKVFGTELAPPKAAKAT